MPVAVAARREEKLKDVVDEIRRGGGRAIAVQVDVTKIEDCERLVAETVREFGSIYSVFANAGYGLEKTIAKLTDREMRDMFDTNFFGTMNTVRPALARMLEAGRGHVLVCSSCLAKCGMPWNGCYSATKAAQEHVTRAMRIELRGTGVTASSVHPIGTATEFFDAKAMRTKGMTANASPPSWAMQPPSRVARAVVACLRRPRPEVWTSMMARVAFACADMSPRLTDWGLTRFASRHPREG
jgi:short-subunit dehydrogenase